MTLPTQILPLVIAGGLAEQVDPLVVEGGAWLTLDNMVFDKAGVLRKRNGYAYLPTLVNTGGDLTTVHQLHVLRDQFLAVCDGTHGERPGLPHAHIWSETLNLWTRKDDVCPATIARSFAVRVVTSTENPQYIRSNGRAVLSWLDDGVGLSFKMFDAEGVVLIPEISVEDITGPGTGPADASSSRLVVCGTTAVWIFLDGATFELKAVNFDLITNTFGTVTVLESPFVFAFYDAVAVSGSEFVLALRVGTGVELRRYNALSLALAASSFQPAFVTPGTLAIAREEATGNLAVCVLDAGPLIRSFVVDSAFGAVWGPITVGSPTGPIDRVSIGFGAAGTTVSLWCGQDGPNAYDRGLFGRRVDAAGAPLGAKRTTWHTELFGRPWLQDDQVFAIVRGSQREAYYLLCLDHTNNSAVPYLLEGYCAHNEASGLKVARLFPLPDATLVDADAPDGRWLVPIQVPATVTTQQEQRGLDLALVNFARWQAAFVSQQMQNCLAQGGAFNGWQDGQVCVEQGYARSPDILAHLVTPGTGNIAGAGVGPSDWNAYLYVAVYEWLDSQGNLHRSEPSIPYEVGVTLAETNATVTIQVRTLCTTRKGDRLDAGTVKRCRIAIYRTLANTPETFYRVDDPTTLTVVNDALYPVRPFSDTLSDTQLVNAHFGILYTRGEVLANELPPPSTAFAVWRNRAWIASAEDSRALWFSQLFFPGEAPGWNIQNQLRVDSSPDGLTALAALRDQLVAFTRDHTYYVSGDGPNDTGAGGAFAGPFLLSESIGCLDHRSVVVFDGGAVFLADPGFYLVSGSGLQLSFIGQPVRETTRQLRTVLGAVHDVARSRLVWLLEGTVNVGELVETQQRFVVFDYLHNTWSTWSVTGTPLVHALWRGRHAWSDETAPAVALESAFYEDPDGSWITSTLETPWLRLAGLMGYQRTRRVLPMVRLDGYCNLDVDLFVDQRETVAQTTTFVLDTGTLSPPPVRGLEMHVAPQKCRALKIRLSDRDASGTSPAFSLVNLSLEAGVKQGRAKLPVADRR